VRAADTPHSRSRYAARSAGEAISEAALKSASSRDDSEFMGCRSSFTRSREDWGGKSTVGGYPLGGILYLVDLRKAGFQFIEHVTAMSVWKTTFADALTLNRHLIAGGSAPKSRARPPPEERIVASPKIVANTGENGLALDHPAGLPALRGCRTPLTRLFVASTRTGFEPCIAPPRGVPKGNQRQHLDKRRGASRRCGGQGGM
jgi:hypothetical protein